MKIDSKNIYNIINNASSLKNDGFVFEDLFIKPRNLSSTKNNIGKFHHVNFKNYVNIFGNKCKNAILYPPLGGMGWHTNGPENGKRIYISWSETGESGMNWYDIEQDIVTIDKDEIGFNIRVFDIPQWHCVWSKCLRFSIGFDIG
jgi:hypothetical protein